jgi:hypothetical protein
MYYGLGQRYTSCLACHRVFYNNRGLAVHLTQRRGYVPHIDL